MTVQQCLIAARSLVTQGWIQGSSSRDRLDGTTAYCAQGAIIAAAFQDQAPELGYGPRHVLAERAMHVIGAVLRARGVSVNIPTWNDQIGRTQAEVIALFDDAIECAAPSPLGPRDRPVPPPIYVPAPHVAYELLFDEVWFVPPAVLKAMNIAPPSPPVQAPTPEPELVGV